MNPRSSRRGPHDVVTTAGRRLLYESERLWDQETLVRRVEHWAAVEPERIAVIDDPCADGYTYAQLLADARSFAAALRARGVVPGSVVSVQMPNWYETVAIDVGVLMAGAVLNPLLTIYRDHEVRNALMSAGVRHIVTPPVYRRTDYREIVRAAADGIDGVEHIVVARGARDVFGAEPVACSARLDAADVSELIFSSGTEAAPKAIMHTEQTTNCGVRLAAGALGLTEEDGVWMPSPIGHSTGLNYGVRMALFHGQTLTLQDQWDPRTALQLIARSRPAYTVAATTFLSDLLGAAEEVRANVNSLRLFGCGGAPVPPVLVEQASRQEITVLRLYGSTEALIGSWNRPDSPWEKRLETDGRPFDHVELEVRDPKGHPVVGEPGELFVRSPTTSVGFCADPERTAASFDTQGWLRTGDLGVLDAEGYFTMAGRKKEILIRGGLNVAPREVEDLLVTMPTVHEAAVIPLAHDRLGEIGCACVVPEPGASPTLDDVVAFLRGRGLAPFKLPERLVIYDKLPKTSTGKIQKFKLITSVAEHDRRAQQEGMTTR
jgi:acyl-CoA synthetase (AMP-forming)/AMP-acid ligase II